MRSRSDDRTSRAIIRDEALRLFAARGADAVTVRQIAAAARVSPALVLRHFGSKDGLREAVDRHVLQLFEAMLEETTAGDGPAPLDPSSAGSIADAIVRHMPENSPIPGYLRRLLLDGSKTGRRLFRRIFEAGRTALDAMVDSGFASAGADPVARATFLTVNDLAMLLLREQISETLGVDPLSAEGMRRWTREVVAVYGSGIGSPRRRRKTRRRP